MSTRVMSDTEIRRRKKVQGHVSQATGALGLAALGGTLAASRGGRTQLRKIPQLKNKIKAPPPKDPDRDKIKGAIVPVMATGAGLSGLGSFNFAAYTNAESRKRKPVVKSLGVDAVVAGEVGFAKDWKPNASKFDAERSRLKRSQGHEDVGAAATGTLAAAAGVKGGQAAYAVRPNWEKGQRKARHLPNVKAAQAARKATAAKHGKVGLGLLAGSGAVGAGTLAVKNRNQSKSWAPYSKRDTMSAFGVDHEISKGRTREQEAAFKANRKRTLTVAGTAGAGYTAAAGGVGHGVHRLSQAKKAAKGSFKSLDEAGAAALKVNQARKTVGRRTAVLGGVALAGAGAMGATGHANNKRWAKASKR